LTDGAAVGKVYVIFAPVAPAFIASIFELDELVKTPEPPIAAFPDTPIPPQTTKAPVPLKVVSVVELM